MGASGACKSRCLIKGREPPPPPTPTLPQRGREKHGDQNVTRKPTFNDRPGSGAFGNTVVVRIDVGV